jgi:hypothetical protein
LYFEVEARALLTLQELGLGVGYVKIVDDSTQLVFVTYNLVVIIHNNPRTLSVGERRPSHIGVKAGIVQALLDCSFLQFPFHSNQEPSNTVIAHSGNVIE